MARKPVVAIDGPAGAGKSTVARQVAERLGYRYLESGAMYRAAALKAARLGIAPTDAARLGELCAALDLRIEAREDGPRVVLDGQDISEAIRDPRAGEWASQISALPEVRRPLVAQQRRMAEAGGIVIEGRDIQTVVCPDAEVKIFLTASVEERARRRLEQLKQEGRAADLEAVRNEVEERDARDQARAHSPLRAAPDAVTINTDGMALDAVVEEILKHVQTAARSAS